MSAIKFQLNGLIQLCVEPEPRHGAKITIQYGGFSITGWGDNMAYKLPDDKTIAVKVAYVDAKGNAAAVDGDVTWSSSDDAIATVTADGSDSMSALITPVGPLGQVQISVTADADLGEGIRELITITDLEIVAGEAIAGTISPVGEPQPIP